MYKQMVNYTHDQFVQQKHDNKMNEIKYFIKTKYKVSSPLSIKYYWGVQCYLIIYKSYLKYRNYKKTIFKNI